MMMANTEPRTLEAAFIAQAHSTRFPLLSSAAGWRQFVRAAARQGPQTGGKRHAHGEAQRDQQPGTDQQFAMKGRPTSRSSRPGSTTT